MISTYKYFEVSDILTEDLGVSLAIPITALFLLNRFSKSIVDNVEDNLLSSYEDDFLTLRITFSEDHKSIMDKLPTFRAKTRLFRQLSTKNYVTLICNKKTMTRLRQKLGEFPIFGMLGKKSKKVFSADEFINSHRKLFGLTNKLKQFIDSNDPAISANAKFLEVALKGIISNISSIKTLEFRSKPANTIYSVEPQ